MKTRRLKLLSVLMFSLTFLIHAYGQNVDVVTTVVPVNPPTGWVLGDPIDFCADGAIVQTIVSSASSTTNFTMTQTLPTGCSLALPYSSECSGNTVVVGGNPNEFVYTFPTVTSTPCTVTVGIIVPCNISSDDIAELTITNTSTTHTINPPPVSPDFQIRIPKMVMDNFKLDGSSNVTMNSVSVPYTATNSAEICVKANTTREFDCKVTNGEIEDFYLTYNPEDEIQTSELELRGFTDVNTAATANVITLQYTANGGSQQFQITASNIENLFGASGYQMSSGNLIRVKEKFNVLYCSGTPNDASTYQLKWNCPAIAANEFCNETEPEPRSVLVRTSAGPIGMALPVFTPALDLCGTTPSDMKLRFVNSNYDAANFRVPGSAMKTLYTIDVPLNTGTLAYSQNNIFLNGHPISDFPTGFYVETGAPDYRVILDFTVLTTANLSSALLAVLQDNQNDLGLVDGFIPNQVYNEIKDNITLELVYEDMTYECQGNTGAPFYDGSTYDDCPPRNGFAFFSRSGGDPVRLTYKDMCESQLTNNTCEADLTCRTEVGSSIMFSVYDAVAFGESDVTDVDVNDYASLDFYYIPPTQDPEASPFLHACPGIGAPYFVNCLFANLTFDAVISIPEDYTIVPYNGSDCPANTTYKITYYPDPNNLSNCELLAVGSATQVGNHLEYPVLDPQGVVTSAGLFRIRVQYGGQCSTDPFDVFTVKIRAICNGCTTCALTIACPRTTLIRHCAAACCDPLEDCPAQHTDNFSFNRAHFGWANASEYPGTSTITATTAGISLNRAYPCDAIKVKSEGGIDPTTLYTVTSLQFLMVYSHADANPCGNHQFFLPVDGTFYYDVGSGEQSYTLPSTNFAGDFSSTSCEPCSLIVNIPLTIGSDNLLAQATTFRVDLNLKVKTLENWSTDPLPGYYRLPQIRAQYVTNSNVGSCDPWGDNMTVLIVRTIHQLTVEGWGRNAAGDNVGCSRHFTIAASAMGGFAYVNDFPNEFRPVVDWPTPFSITLPDPDANTPVYSFSSNPAHFNFRSFLRPAPLGNWAQIHTTVSGQTMNFYYNSSLDDWPLLEMDGYSNAMEIEGQINNDCAPQTEHEPAWYTANDPLLLTINNPSILVETNFPYIRRAYSQDQSANCYEVFDSPDMVVPRVRNWLELSIPPSSPYFITETNPTLVGCVLSFKTFPAGLGEFNVVENVWVKVTSSYLTATELRIYNPVSQQWSAWITPVNGYFNIGKLVRGNEYPIEIRSTVSDCNPATQFPVNIEFGYQCSTDNTDPCFSDSETITIEPRESVLAMTAVLDSDPPGSPCGEYEYLVTLTSSDLGNVSNPSVTITLPPGLTFVGDVAWEAFSPAGSGNIPVVTPSGNSYTWNLADYSSIYSTVWNNNGIPGGGGKIELRFTVTGDCSLAGETVTIEFHAEGSDICGNLLEGGDTPIDVDRNLEFDSSPAIGSPSIAWNGPAALGCGFSDIYRATISNFSGLFVGDLIFRACFPTNVFCTVTDLGVTAVANYTYNSLGNGCHEWIIPSSNIVTTSIVVNISVSTCASVSCGYHTIDGFAQFVATCSNGVCATANSLEETESVTPHVCCCSDFSASINGTNPLCAGSLGSATANNINGNPPFTYAWSTVPPQITATIINLTAGTYTCTITDATGCTASGSATITDPPSAIQISFSGVQNVSCYGGNNGTATANSSGGTGTHTYLWSNGQTSSTATGLSAGSYTVTVTDANGCTATRVQPITEPAALNAQVAIKPACFGLNNGSARVEPTGGTSPYTYLWSYLSQTTQMISNLSAATYTVTVTDANGCQQQGTGTVTINPQIILSSATDPNAIIPPTSNGGNDGAIDLSVSGGTSPYSYLWSNAATTQDISGLTSGTYTVTVTDDILCTATQSYFVPEPPEECDAGFATYTQGGYGNCGFPGQFMQSNFGSEFPGGLTIGCTGTGSNTLEAGCYQAVRNFLPSGTQNTGPQVLNATYSNPRRPGCNFNGNCACAVNVDCVPSNPAIYSNVFAGQVMTLTLNLGFDGVTGFSTNTYPFSDLYYVGSGPFYGLTVGEILTEANAKLGGCTTTVGFSYTISELNNTVDLINKSWDNAQCPNGSCGILSCTAGSSLMSLTTSDLQAACMPYNLSCVNGYSGSILTVVNGGTPPYTYLWSTGATTADLTSLAPGIYAVTVTDDDENSVLRFALVYSDASFDEPVYFTTDITNLTVDFTDNSTESSSGAVQSWAWNFGDPSSGSNNTSTQQNPSHTFTAEGTYNVCLTVTYTSGISSCQKMYCGDVCIKPVSVSIAATATTICSGTSVIFTATPTNGGSSPSYQWKRNGNNVGTNSTTYENSSLADSDVITCVLTSNATPCATGNPATSNSITMTVNPLPDANTGGNQNACVGIGISLGAAPVSGHTYSWSPSTNLSSATVANPTFTSSTTGSFNYDLVETITATGCYNFNDNVVFVSPTFPVSISISASPSSTICSGTSVTFTASPTNQGGSPTYQWKLNGSNVGTNSSTYVNSSLANSDVITCVLTSSLTLCPTGNPATSNSITMTVNPLPVANTGSNQNVCSGETISIGAAAVSGNTYSWSPTTNLSSGTVSNPTFTSSTAGTTNYTLTETVTATGCQKSNGVSVTVISGGGNPTFTCNSSNLVVATPYTTCVSPGSNDYLMMQVKITLGGGCSGAQRKLKTLKFDASSATCNNIENAKLWYSGNSGSFSNAQIVSGSGTITSVSCSANNTWNAGTLQVMQPGDNYFWVTFKIRSTANVGETVQATLASVTVVANGSHDCSTSGGSTSSRTIESSGCGNTRVDISETQPGSDNISITVYPNPFTDQTTFHFVSQKDAEVLLELFDISGQKLKTIFSGKVESGKENDVELFTSGMGAGIYYYRLNTEEEIAVGKLLIVK